MVKYCVPLFGAAWGTIPSAADRELGFPYVVSSLPSQRDEIFCHAKFSCCTEQVLYTTTNREEGGGSIFKWNTRSWTSISSTNVSRDRVSAMDVSPDGKLISVGTNEGDILIISCAKMRVHSVVREAHRLPVTALAFSFDSTVLLSASMDSSARLTMVEDKKRDIWDKVVDSVLD